MSLQLQLLAIACAIGFFFFTIHLVKKDFAETRQIIKWLVIAIVILFIAIFPKLGSKIAYILGINTLTSLSLFVLTGLLLVITLTLHLSIMKAEKQIKILTQELSLLKKRINDQGDNT